MINDLRQAMALVSPFDHALGNRLDRYASIIEQCEADLWALPAMGDPDLLTFRMIQALGMKGIEGGVLAHELMEMRLADY